MPYDKDTYFGADSRGIRFRAYIGCLTCVMCVVVFTIGLMALIVWLVRAVIG